MKNIITLIALLSITFSSFAQNGISYKAVIKDNLGNVIANQNVDIRFTILNTTNPNVYEETHTALTDSNGIVIVNIGEGSTTDVFTDIVWESDIHSLKTEIDPEQDGSFVDMGTSEFKTVPYALSVANSVKSIDDLTDGKSDDDGYSIFLGTESGHNDDGTYNQNVGIGYHSLYTNTTGVDNVAIGFQALYANQTGHSNIAIGTTSLQNTTGNANIGLGYRALFTNTSGSDNLAIGYEALFSNTTGVNNNAYGTHALRENTTGFFNNAFGRHALQSNTTGPGNTAMGHGSLRDNTTGSNNTAVGNGAGDNVNGNNNVFVGRGAGLGLPNSTNSGNIVIGNEAGSGADYNNRLYVDNSNTSNPLIYGEFDNNFLRINGSLEVNNALSVLNNGNVGIGNLLPDKKLVVDGTAKVQSIEFGDNTVQTSAALVPLAYGAININGTILAGSGNFTATWNAIDESYHIAITNETNTQWYNYITVINNAFPGNDDISSSWVIAPGTIQVVFVNPNNDWVQAHFTFITYKIN
ncbi:hypothetical protein [Winogradskyella pulchriflava]|uniref:Trimeric autotransporter adhesin YadA-like head domain-containing protein n=1 Tax=Winogradskyella pulchriflava TaxID=1110688 RepID=A0ABV6QAN7_9FLAO